MIRPAMKIIIGLSLIFLVSAIFEDREVCRKFLDEGLKICYKSGTFTRINDLYSRPNKSLRLQLHDTTDYTIAPNAFINSSNITAIKVGFFLRHPEFPASLSLKGNSFAGIPELKSLELSDVTINFNNENPLAPLRSLQVLIIKMCYLTQVPTEMLASVPKLRSLDLFGNRIRSIRSNSFTPVRNIEYLNLANNGIVFIELGAFNELSKLRELMLHQNALQVFNGNFQDNPKLNVLDKSYILAKNQREVDGFTELKNIPMSIFDNLTALRILDLSDNRITRITPGAFCRLNLLKLDFSRNIINVIEPNTFNGCSIDHLSLSGCYIETLKSGAFNGLTTKELELELNKLKIIGLGDFDGLNSTEVSLWRNKLETIANGAFNKTVMKKLHIGYMPKLHLTNRHDLGLSKSVEVILSHKDAYDFVFS